MFRTFLIRLMPVLSALVLAASCGRESADVRPYGEDSRREIRFGAGIATKAFASAAVDNLKSDGFNALCIVSNGVQMFDDPVVWDASRNLFTPSTQTYYYPNSGSLSFYASYPPSYKAMQSGNSVTLSYVHDSSTDLLAARAEGVTAQDNPVALEMNHILSLLHFKAAGRDIGVTYRVTRLAVTVPSKGVYDYASGLWSVEGTEESLCFSGSVTLEGTAAIGIPLSVLPCKAAIRVDWETWQGDVKTAEYSRVVTMDESLAPGEECTVTLRLSNDKSQPMEFTLNITPWTGTDKEIDIR